MSFVTNALGVNNGYTATSGAAPNQAAANAQQTTDLSNLNSTYGNQGDLAKQLLAQSQGAGPNIANLQLQQATNQNNQQGAAAVASQRGMNPALAARIIANQTATNNQNAAGQSGVLRAQQQLAAEQGLANVYGQQAGEVNQNYNTITGAQTAANNANAQIAQNNTNANSQVASGIIGGGAQMLSSILGSAYGGEVKSPEKHLEELLISLGNKVKPKKLSSGGSPASGGNPLGNLGSTAQNAIDPALAQGQNLTGMFGMAGAGTQAEGPGAGATSMQGQDDTLFGGSSIGNSGVSGLTGAAESNPLSGMTGEGLGKGLTMIAAEGGEIPHYGLGGLLKLAALFAQGGKVNAMISPGERVVPPHLVEAVRNGKLKASKVAPKVPGKAKVKGDNLKNDVVPAKLAEGSVVIKRTKADNDADAREFLLALKKEKAQKEGPQGYAKVLAARRKNA